MQTQEIETNRDQRRKAVQIHKRGIITAAAKQVFAEHGLEGASMRKIAAASGYTAAAIYFYFDSKEELYAALLSEVLKEMSALLEAAAEVSSEPERRARSVLAAFFDFYRQRPQEFDLSYYLFQGVRPRGLTPLLNNQLNDLLDQALKVVAESLAKVAGKSLIDVWPDTVGCLAHMTGVVLLNNTSRLRVLSVDDQTLETQFIDGLVARLRST